MKAAGPGVGLQEKAPDVGSSPRPSLPAAVLRAPWVQAPGPPYLLLFWELRGFKPQALPTRCCSESSAETALHFLLGGGSYTSLHHGKDQMSPLPDHFTLVLIHCVKATLHLQLLQNIGYIPRVVRYILIAYLTPNTLYLRLPPLFCLPHW